MFWHVLSMENTKISKRRMFWVLMVIIALVVLVIQLVLFSTYKKGMRGVAMPEEERLSMVAMITWPGALEHILTIVRGNAFGGLFFVILVGTVTAQEYTWRTLHLWLSRGVPRFLLVVAKFSALLLPALSFTLVALFVGGTISAALSSHIQSSASLGINAPHLVLSLLRTVYSLLPYGALTFFLAVLSRSTAVAISGGLSYVLLLESLLLQLMGLLGEPMRTMSQYLPTRLVESLMSGNQLRLDSGSISSAGGLNPWAAVFGIACWTLLLLGLSLWVFQKQDLSE